MRKPLPSRALRRLLLLAAAGVAGTTVAQAQVMNMPVMPPRATTPGDTTKTPDQSMPAITVFTPSVTDENGEPLRGVTLANGGANSYTVVTDSLGQARMPDVKAGETLTVSIEGSVIRRYTATDDLTPIILLDTKNPAVARLKPVRLLFGTSLPADLTAASTQTVYNAALLRLPVTSFVTALAGQGAGLQVTQISGQPGSDAGSASLLGRFPTVVIDGVVRPIYNFDLEEIESVTLLKDALSTSMLGVRNTNGGILNVTTRRGTPGQPRISFTVQSAIQEPIKLPKPLDAYNYASLYNEAQTNDNAANPVAGFQPRFSADDLQKYRDGSDPIGHPNVNWFDQLLKKSSKLDRYTFSATGGNKFSRYFVSLEHLSQTGLLKTSDINKYNTSNDYKAYIVRSNVDLQLSKKLTGGIGLLGRILTSNDTGANFGQGLPSILNALYNTPALAYPVYNANGSYGGTQQFQNNLWAQTIGSGYRQLYNRDVVADFYLRRTLDEVTPGLWVKAMASYYASLSETVYRDKTFAVFVQGANAAGQPTYTQYGTNGDQQNNNGVNFQNNTTYLEADLGYDRQLGNHGLHAVALASRQSLLQDSDLPYTVQGLSGRASYNYKGKYVAELAFGLNGSNRYPDNGDFKYGFFPSAGLAWNMSREDFMKGTQPWLSYLKLYGSYGLTGNDVPGYFTYIQTYFDTSAPYFGTGAGTQFSNSEQVLASRNRTWEKGRKLSLGLQGAVLDNHLGFTVEYYNSLYYDLLQQRGRSSTLIGQLYPDENIGRNRYQGLTTQLSYQQNFGQLSLLAAVNVGVQYSKVEYQDEVYRPYPWMQRTGQPVGQAFGYVADGLFQNQAEIQGAATIVGYTPQPGDIRYKDLNGDGVINQFDVAPIGRSNPSIPFGLTLGARYKGFDFTTLLQGSLSRVIYLSGASEYAFQNGGFGGAFEQHLDRWTPSNPGASYPRLSLGNNLNNYAPTSSYWLHDDSYMRLKNVELGYTLPLNLSKRVRLQGIRFFANGTNLVTFSQYDRVDPEIFTAAYPQQRLINFGVNLKL
ncbi:SusC/RagA family TonB-linked outer membrane protein [Hymenobacter rubidus]|uniref:SusC/RagA family TonB-linked outer membrane protein n=1 Tax=Hymenobacter rubidus TaxID=1441626 RepID=UPI00191F0538|nr:SusC/RagA family TonB-linked outer membrane protein [Hymenobacter rubidus]